MVIPLLGPENQALGLQLLTEQSFQALDVYKSEFLTSIDWKVVSGALTRVLVLV